MANYVDKKELLREVIASKANLKPGQEDLDVAGAMTKKLSDTLYKMVEGIASKPCFSGYSYIDDMKADAHLNICHKWHKFDETRFDNAFAYYTTMIYRSFFGTLGKEKKTQALRDKLLEEAGMNPSHTRQTEAHMEFLEEERLEEERRKEETEKRLQEPTYDPESEAYGDSID